MHVHYSRLVNFPIVDSTLEKYITLFTTFKAAYHDKSILEKTLQVSNVLKTNSYPRKTVVTGTIATGYFAVIYTLQRCSK